MTLTLEETINRRTYNPLGWMMSRPTFWVLLALIAYCVFMFLRSDVFLTPNNIFNITRNFTFTAIIALGMTIVIITGGIDLSVGSVLCLISMILATVMHIGYPIYVGIAVAIVCSILVGTFNGILIAYVGLPPFVVTLGMLSVARSLAMIISNNTVVFQFGPDHDKLLLLGGGSTKDMFLGLAGLFPEGSGLAGMFTSLSAAIIVPFPVVYTIILALIVGFILRWTRFGRHVFAIGGNEHAAELTGVPVKRVKVLVYVISSLSAGLAAVVMTGWLGAVTTNLGAGMELQVIAATVIGGAALVGGSGTAIGALIGAALIEVIRNSLALLGINPFWQGTFIGSLIIIAVLFEPVRNLIGSISDRMRGQGG